MRKCLSNLMLFLPAMAYLAVSLILDEEHPFSRFAMYSSFPEYSDYYFLSSEDGTAIPGVKNGLVSLAQLKDIMNNRLESADAVHDLPLLSNVGKQVLDSLCTTAQGAQILKQQQAVNLSYHRITSSDDGVVKHEEFILSTCRPN
jgi:hypothetical protein